MNKRIYWIDLAKLLAILAVVIQHSYPILYSDERILYATFYEVSVFILLGGITNYWSLGKNDEHIVLCVLQKCGKILAPYFVATLVYQLVAYKQFDLIVYLYNIVHFNASAPLYYVLLYVQLLIVSPVIYYLFQLSEKMKYSVIFEGACFLLVIVISSFTTNHTQILDVNGGGGKLFGGTFLVLYYLGMWFGKYYNRITVGKVTSVILSIICMVCTILWDRFLYLDRLTIDSYLPFGKGNNPPSVSIGLYALLVACTVYFCDRVLSNTTRLYPLWGNISVAGKYTLNIFLYHRLFLDYFIPKLRNLTQLEITNPVCKVLFYLLLMIGGSILLGSAVDKSISIIKSKILLDKNCNITSQYKRYLIICIAIEALLILGVFGISVSKSGEEYIIDKFYSRDGEEQYYFDTSLDDEEGKIVSDELNLSKGFYNIELFYQSTFFVADKKGCCSYLQTKYKGNSIKIFENHIFINDSGRIGYKAFIPLRNSNSALIMRIEEQEDMEQSNNEDTKYLLMDHATIAADTLSNSLYLALRMLFALTLLDVVMYGIIKTWLFRNKY